MKNSPKKPILFMLSVFLFVYSCKKDGKQSSSPTATNAQQVLSYIKSLGYLDGHIFDNGKEYVVEGDIVFSKSMKVPAKKIVTTEQYYNGTLCDLNHQFAITVSVDPSLAAQANEINDAVALWNNAGAYVSFVVIPNGGHILLTNAPIGNNTCAQANGFPANGIAATQVTVDALFEAAIPLNYSQRMITIAHELGHCIGFRHTNGDPCCGFGTPVPGWGGTDASSIMNGNACGTLPTVLSTKDIGAVNALYPKINYPQNTQATVSPSNFSVTWWAPVSNPSDAIVGYTVDYSGFSGTNFGGSTQVSTSTFSYTIPGANPSAPGTSGYFRVTISARYASGATIPGTMQSWFKTGSTWHQ